MLATAVKSVVNQKIRLVEVYMESAANVEEDYFASLQLEKKEWLKQLRLKKNLAFIYFIFSTFVGYTSGIAGKCSKQQKATEGCQLFTFQV